jgi:hypothetical protein
MGYILDVDWGVLTSSLYWSNQTGRNKKPQSAFFFACHLYLGVQMRLSEKVDGGEPGAGQVQLLSAGLDLQYSSCVARRDPRLQHGAPALTAPGCSPSRVKSII